MSITCFVVQVVAVDTEVGKYLDDIIHNIQVMDCHFGL